MPPVLCSMLGACYLVSQNSLSFRINISRVFSMSPSYTCCGWAIFSPPPPHILQKSFGMQLVFNTSYMRRRTLQDHAFYGAFAGNKVLSVCVITWLVLSWSCFLMMTLSMCISLIPSFGQYYSCNLPSLPVSLYLSCSAAPAPLCMCLYWSWSSKASIIVSMTSP